MRLLLLLAICSLGACMQIAYEDLGKVQTSTQSPPTTVTIVDSGDANQKPRNNRSDFWRNGPDGPFETLLRPSPINDVLPPECLLISPRDPDRYVFGEQCLEQEGKTLFFLPDDCRVIARMRGGNLVPAYRARCMIEQGYELAANR